MSYERTLNVAFTGTRVSVTSNCYALICDLERGFAAMLDPVHGPTQGWVEARRNGVGYRIRHSRGEAYAPTTSLAVQSTVDAVVAELIQSHPEMVWLHAGAAADQEAAVLVAGEWGRGKSTIVTALCNRGWSFLSDDVIALDPGQGLALPFPRTPSVREDPGEELPRERLVELRRREIHPTEFELCRRATPIASVILPRYERGVDVLLESVPRGEAALTLLSCCFNFHEAPAMALRVLGGLARRIPVYRLRFGNPASAVSAVQAVWAGAVVP